MGSNGSKACDQRPNNAYKTVSTRSLTTQMSVDENEVNWEIANFTKLQEIKSPNCEKTLLPIRAGPYAWRLELGLQNEMSLFLVLEESPPEPGSTPYETATAQFAWSILDMNSKILIVPEVATPIRKYTTEISSPIQNQGSTSKVSGRWGYWGPNFVTLDKLRTVGALVDDTLRIRVKITVYWDERVMDIGLESSEKMLKQNAVDEIGKHFAALLKTGLGADFVIRVKKLDSEQYFEKRVHQNILSARSPVFEAMLRSSMSEKETGVVTIKDLTPKGLDILLEFIYTGNVSNDWKLVPEEVLNAAEKYDLPLLKDYIAEWLHTAATPENSLILLDLAKKTGLTKASKNISDYIKSNLENVLSNI